MCWRLGFLVLVSAGVSAPVHGADDGIPAETLAGLKAATVFVKNVDGAKWGVAGTGFLIHVDGETGYIVAIHHVATAEPPPDGSPAHLSVVFESGTKKERSLPADVVFADADMDIAVLKVTSKELPRPLDLDQKPDVRRGMTIHCLGYPPSDPVPYTNRPHSAISVARGTVANLRNQPGKPQIQNLRWVDKLQMRAGFSGGPVVDDEGKLIAVALARPKDKQVDSFIPAANVIELLGGRAGAVVVRQWASEKGTAFIELEVPYFGAAKKVKSISVRYLSQDSLKDALAADKNGVWPPLPNGKQIQCSGDGLCKRGNLLLRLEDTKNVPYLFQTVVVNGDGKAIWGRPTTAQIILDGSITTRKPADPSGGSGSTVTAPRPKALELAAALPQCLTAVFEPSSRNVFLGAGDGSLQLYSYPDFSLRACYTLHSNAIAYQGALDADRGLLYLAASKNKAFRKFPYYFNIAHAAGDILVFDVKAILQGKDLVSGELDPVATMPVDAAIQKLVLSVDGKMLYFLDVKTPDHCRLCQLNTQTKKVQSELKLASRTEAMCVTPDHKFIYTAASPDGHDATNEGPYRGIIQQIDPAAMRVQKEWLVDADPAHVAVTNQGVLFVAGGSGPRTDIAVIDVNATEPVVAHWKAPRRICDLQLTPDQKTLLVDSRGIHEVMRTDSRVGVEWRPGFLQAWAIPSRLKESRAIVREEARPDEEVVGGPLFVSPDGKCTLCCKGGAFWLQGGKPPKKDGVLNREGEAPAEPRKQARQEPRPPQSGHYPKRD